MARLEILCTFLRLLWYQECMYHIVYPDRQDSNNTKNISLQIYEGLNSVLSQKTVALQLTY